MITVIDYGMGNSGSIMSILRRIGAEAILTSDPGDIARAAKLVLPGVGAFDRGMEQLHKLRIVPVLQEKVVGEGTPILGICLGMQLFVNGSEEGTTEGLGWIEGRAVRFRFQNDPTLRIPHMGWNILQVHKPHTLLDGADSDARFYFVHAYHVVCQHREDVLATTSYGLEFVSAVAKGSIIGIQFHAEKSLRWGIAVFRKFVHDVQRSTPARDPVSAAAEHRAGQDRPV